MTKITKLALLLALVGLIVLAGPSGAALPITAATAPALTPTEPPTSLPTLTPTLPPIVESGYEILFPVMIRFYVTLRLKTDQVKSAKLHVFQGGVIDQTINVSIQDSVKVLNDNASIVYVPWLLDANNAPVPFEKMSFDWTVESNANLTYKSGSITFDYSDPYQKWFSLIKEPINLYAPNNWLALDVIRKNVMRTYDLIAADTSIKRAYNFIIYEVGGEPCQVDPKRPKQKVLISGKDGSEFACDPANAPKIYAAHGYTMIQRITPQFEQVQNQIIAYIADDAYSQYWKAEAPPAWFRSGVLSLYQLTGHVNDLLVARDAASLDRLLTLDTLAAPPAPNDKDNGASLRAWNGQSYMLTLYLAARFGVRAPFEIGKQVAGGTKFADALASVGGGVTLETLYNDWRKWLFSPDADAAIRWNPYLTENTPTPTVTPTDEPSLTPTSDQPSETPTASETHTRVPTRTLTPTNTALPPGSLPSITAIPSATPVKAAQSSGFSLPCRGASVLLSAPLIVLTIRRRKRVS